VTLAIDNINMTGAVITNIVSDNATSNISMLRILGAKLSDPEDLKVTIDLQNVLQEPILVVVDT